MEKVQKEKPPFWFPIAPIMVVVFIYLILLLSRYILAGLDLNSYLGLPAIIKYPTGSILIIIGLLFFIRGFIQLKPAAAIGFAKKLRATGAYGLTRNPMYFGVNAAFWGTGLVLDDLSVLFAAFIWSLFNYLSVILWEEKQMAGKFGDEYLEYKKRVPRFIPLRLKR